MARRKQKSNKLVRFVLWSLLILVLLAGAAVAGGYLWVQNYLHSPAFREALAKNLGKATHSKADIAQLTLNGSSIYVPKLGLTPDRISGWKGVEADGLQANLDLSTWRQGVWTVPRIDIDWLRLELAAPAIPGAKQADPDDDEVKSSLGALPSWLQGWIPQRTDVSSVNVQSFEMLPPMGGKLEINSMKLNAKPATGDNTWLLRGEDGTLRVPGVSEPFRITSMSASVDGRNLALNDSLFRWIGESEVTGRGDVPFDSSAGWTFKGRFTNLDLRYVLARNWQGQVSGMLEGDYEVSSHDPSLVIFKSKAKINNGVVQNLPVLDRIADFTHTDRFRRVVLDEASGDVEHQGAMTKITNLIIQSNGLIRVEGEVVLEGRSISGNLYVGVFPETLRWMPGAQSHVFTQQMRGGPPGFVWTQVHITGTLDDPKEDLSSRLMIAMGKAVLDAPMSILNIGTDVLENAGGKAGKTVIEGGRDLLHGADNVLEKGADTVKELVPFLQK